jgi:23S rRNA pseudouridine1911/1915/1917 synthase
MTPIEIETTSIQEGMTLAACLRSLLPGQSWSAVRQLVESRRVRLAGELCLDPARRLKAGLHVEVLARSLPKPRTYSAITIRYLDAHVVVVEKPSGFCTVRHPSERDWNARRKALSPSLEDLVPHLIADREGQSRKAPQPRLRIVQRLDKETSGLLVYARSVIAEREMGRQFRVHSVIRRYLAIVFGQVQPQRIASRLVRDRGDGRRGSTTLPGVGKEAVTHVKVVERLHDATLVGCQLETGRTHQIRIHLAELGHPVCGDKVYGRTLDGKEVDRSLGAPRLALHAAELGFRHPVHGNDLHWTMPLPPDLEDFLNGLRAKSAPRSNPKSD